jgi:hypothetical protein
MPRHRVTTTSRPPPRQARSTPPVWFLGWFLSHHQLSRKLAMVLWQALTASTHPTARAITTFWRKFHQHGDLHAQAVAMNRHLAQVSVAAWAEVLEELVATGALSWVQANAVLDHLLVQVDARGQWV